MDEVRTSINASVANRRVGGDGWCILRLLFNMQTGWPACSQIKYTAF